MNDQHKNDTGNFIEMERMGTEWEAIMIDFKTETLIFTNNNDCIAQKLKHSFCTRI